jgi:DNA-binding response OmpR family regulator
MPTKVLVIDDDLPMTKLIQMIFTAHGFQVVAANSGEAGLNLLQDFAPDVLVLDLMMPGMDGWQVCAAVRVHSDVPILIVSALDDPGQVIKALDAGADDYLTKPVSSGELIAHVNKLARRPELNRPNDHKLPTTPSSA